MFWQVGQRLLKIFSQCPLIVGSDLSWEVVENLSNRQIKVTIKSISQMYHSRVIKFLGACLIKFLVNAEAAAYHGKTACNHNIVMCSGMSIIMFVC